jgi:hypothetical protein
LPIRVAGFEEPNYCRENLLFGHAAEPNVAIDHPADAREHASECQHAIELRKVAGLAVSGMIAVLLPSLCVAANGLNVTVARADPDGGPGRRDH